MKKIWEKSVARRLERRKLWWEQCWQRIGTPLPEDISS